MERDTDLWVEKQTRQTRTGTKTDTSCFWVNLQAPKKVGESVNIHVVKKAENKGLSLQKPSSLFTTKKY